MVTLRINDMRKAPALPLKSPIWWLETRFDVFTALHEMQTRSSDEKAVRRSVCLCVCLSVCQTRGLRQNGRKICPDFYTIRKSI